MIIQVDHIRRNQTSFKSQPDREPAVAKGRNIFQHCIEIVVLNIRERVYFFQLERKDIDRMDLSIWLKWRMNMRTIHRVTLFACLEKDF